MAVPKTVEDLFEQIYKIENSGVTAGSERFIRFCIECLSLIRHRLPSIALDALDVSAEYLSGRVALAQITETVVRCWQQLDNNYKGKDVDVPDVSAIRAVIFILDSLRHPDETDIFDRLQYFLQFINNVEPHVQEEGMLLNKHFANCTSGPSITQGE